MKVRLQIADDSLKRYDIPDEKSFAQWADAALTLDSEVVARVVGEDESKSLNSQYGGKNKPTNVLAFPHMPISRDEKPYLGDVVINAPLVIKEAAEQGLVPRAHWAHLFVHALLHLTGYDHETEETTAIMRARETEILNYLNITSPWQTQ